MKYAPLSLWNDFVQNAPPKYNLCHRKLYVTSHVQTKPLQVECEKGTRKANCNAPSELALLKTKGFCVVWIVSVFFSNHAPFTGEELRQNILEVEARWSGSGVRSMDILFLYTYKQKITK